MIFKNSQHECKECSSGIHDESGRDQLAALESRIVQDTGAATLIKRCSSRQETSNLRGPAAKARRIDAEDKEVFAWV